MRTRTTWMVVGGAAALVLTPIATVYGSTPLEEDLHRGSVVVDGEAANQARAARTAAEHAQAQPSTLVTKKPTAKATVEPTGKKTVSAASPVSPRTPVSPVSPNTAN